MDMESQCRDKDCQGDHPPGLVDSESEKEEPRRDDQPPDFSDVEMEASSESEDEKEYNRRWFGKCTSPMTKTTARERLRPYPVELAALEVLRTMQQDHSVQEDFANTATFGSVGRLRSDTDDDSCEGTSTSTRIRHPLHVETQNAKRQFDGLDFRKPVRNLDISVMTEKHKSTISAVQRPEEWIAVEITVDSGACVTVMPAGLCTGIPILDNALSKGGVEYEVANGESIPNLGERRCEVMTVGSLTPKLIVFQIADVHKPLLSVTACSDMGFDCFLGKEGGSLKDRVTGELIPLERQGSLYTMKMWIRQDQSQRPSPGFSGPP